MSNKKLLNIITMCILIAIPILGFLALNLKVLNIINYSNSINPAIVFYFCLPFLIYIYINDIVRNKRKLDIYDYLFLSFIFVSILSTIFSLDIKIAILGKDYRHEGLISILSYIFLALNWKENGTKDDIKKYIKLLVVISIINSIYAIFQIYFDFDFVFCYNELGKMASGLCGNPNFFGSFIVTILSILTCKFFIKKGISLKLCLILIFLCISLYNCQSTGPILTYVIMCIFLTIFLSIKKLANKIKVIIFYITLLCFSLAIFSLNALKPTIKQELSSALINYTIESGGNGRLKIWRNSLNIVKKHPILGVGYDNFYLAYPNDYTGDDIIISNIDNNVVVKKKSEIVIDSEKNKIKDYTIIDNAHNVYLHLLVSTGILGLIPYLLICLFVFIKGLKLKDKEGILLLSGFVAYSIQAFANISVIQVAPIFYLIMGLILSIKE